MTPPCKRNYLKRVVNRIGDALDCCYDYIIISFVLGYGLGFLIGVLMPR